MILLSDCSSHVLRFDKFAKLLQRADGNKAEKAREAANFLGILKRKMGFSKFLQGSGMPKVTFSHNSLAGL